MQATPTNPKPHVCLCRRLKHLIDIWLILFKKSLIVKKLIQKSKKYYFPSNQFLTYMGSYVYVYLTKRKKKKESIIQIALG